MRGGWPVHLYMRNGVSSGAREHACPALPCANKTMPVCGACKPAPCCCLTSSLRALSFSHCCRIFL